LRRNRLKPCTKGHLDGIHLKIDTRIVQVWRALLPAQYQRSLLLDIRSRYRRNSVKIGIVGAG